MGKLLFTFTIITGLNCYSFLDQVVEKTLSFAMKLVEEHTCIKFKPAFSEDVEDESESYLIIFTSYGNKYVV